MWGARATHEGGRAMTTFTKLTLPFGIEGTDIRSRRHFRPSAGRCKSGRNCGRTWVWRGLCRSPNKWHKWAPSAGRLQMLRLWPFSRCKHRHGPQHFRSRKSNQGDGWREGGPLCVASYVFPTNQVALLYYPCLCFSRWLNVEGWQHRHWKKNNALLVYKIIPLNTLMFERVKGHLESVPFNSLHRTLKL